MVAAVQVCPECGNHGMDARVVAEATVHECTLCGARIGDPAALAALDDLEQARARGIAVGVWPLVRALERLAGVCVRAARAPDGEARTLPFVELGATSGEALRELENLCKSLQLAASALRLHWVVELEYQRHLAFVLKPRHGGGPVALATVHDAAHDAEVLAQRLDRDRRLAWWRHAGDGAVQ